MKTKLAGSLGLVLGLLASRASAQDWKWQPASAQTAPASSLGVALGRPVAASAVSTSSGISLDRPVPIGAESRASFDSQVLPTSYSSASDRPVYRAKDSDDPQPMPPGPPSKQPSKLKVDAEPAAKVQSTTPSMEAAPEEENLLTTFRRKFRSIVGDSPTTYAAGAPANGDCADPCGNCGDICCDFCNDPCRPSNSLWFRGEYLLWKIKQGNAPALVTMGSSSDVRPGALGQTGTTELFGGPLNYEDLSGGRVTVGAWLPCAPCWGIEGSYFGLGERSVNFNDSSSGNPVLARPFLNLTRGGEDAELVAGGTTLPLSGSISIRSTTQLKGAEINAIRVLDRDPCSCCFWWWGKTNLLFGFRYLNLEEDLDIRESLVSPANSAIPGDLGASFQVGDRFATRNNFYGGQVGFKTSWSWRRWDLDLTTKVALGDMNQAVNISGSTSIAANTPTGVTTSSFNGGLLALPTNIGHYSRDRFAVVPEVGLTVAYNIRPWVRFLVGYNFLYASNVARPGEQIDRGINTTQIPPGTLSGVARPTFVFHDSEFWAQGVTIGFEFRY